MPQIISITEQIDQAIELLYEELPEKLRGTGIALQLAQKSANLEILAQHGKFIFKKKSKILYILFKN